MDDYDKYLEQQKNRGKFHFKLFEKTKPIHIFLFFILFVIAIWISRTNQAKWVYFVLGGLGVIFILSMFKQGDKREPLPRSLAVSIAKKDVESEIAAGRVFAYGTKIIPTGYFRDQSWNDGNGPVLFKYNIGFTAQPPNKMPIDIVYQMEPFTGRCKGIIEKPLGFTGEDIKDRDIILPEKIIKEDKDQSKISTA